MNNNAAGMYRQTMHSITNFWGTLTTIYCCDRPGTCTDFRHFHFCKSALGILESLKLQVEEEGNILQVY